MKDRKLFIFVVIEMIFVLVNPDFSVRAVASDALEAPSLPVISQNSYVCTAIQSQLQHMSLSTTALAWPTLLHFRWLAWPSWITFDPNGPIAKKLDIIKKFTTWGADLEAEKLNAKDQRLDVSQQKIDADWNKYWLPQIQAATRDNSLEMQTAIVKLQVGATPGLTTSATIIRFRIKQKDNQTFAYLLNHLSQGTFYTDGNWVYLIEKTSINSNIENIPISPNGENVHGELGFILGQPVIFETGEAYYAPVDVISLTQEDNLLQSVSVSQGCFLKLPAFLHLHRIPSPAELSH